MRSLKLTTPFLAAASFAQTITARNTSAYYSTRMISSVMTRQQGLVSSGESTSTLESGLIALCLQSWLSDYQSTADSETVSNVTTYMEQIIATMSATEGFTNVTKSLGLPLDRLMIGQAITNLDDALEAGLGGGDGAHRELTQNEALALDTLNTSLALQHRNQYGGFWYVESIFLLDFSPPFCYHADFLLILVRYYVYSNWSYLDGAVSFLPFMVSDDSWSYTDALNQITLLWTYCTPQTNTSSNSSSHNGLLVHGYDASKTAVWANPVTGGSPYVWGRSLGWYLMGLVNAWEILLDNADRDAEELMLAIQSQFTSLVYNLLPYADEETGAWWQLTTFPGRAGNWLESSSTALFVFSILKGLRLQLLTSNEWRYPHTDKISQKNLTETALHAYDTLVNAFVVDYGNGTLGYNGTVTMCSLNSTATYEYYTKRPINFNAPLGEGAFILASLEVERLGLVKV